MRAALLRILLETTLRRGKAEESIAVFPRTSTSSARRTIGQEAQAEGAQAERSERAHDVNARMERA